MTKPSIKYIELKSGHGDDGPAWIAHVETSKSGQTIYFNDRALVKDQGISGNYFDFESDEEYWVSGVKRRGSNRHTSGTGSIMIEETAIQAFLELRGLSELPKGYDPIPPLTKTDKQRITRLQNEKL